MRGAGASLLVRRLFGPQQTTAEPLPSMAGRTSWARLRAPAVPRGARWSRRARGGRRWWAPSTLAAYQMALEEPDAFWPDVAMGLVWDRKWVRVIDDHRRPFTSGFRAARSAYATTRVDRHVAAGQGDKVAIIYDSPVTNTVAKITYKELKEQVSRLAGVLKKWGIRKGDRVVIYMPMIPETIYAMLACSRIGAVHSLVFGGFAAKELAVRINHAQGGRLPVGHFGIEPKETVPYKTILDEAIQISEYKPKKCLIYMRAGQARARRR
ncbi:hypothetical protein HPB48_005350 [Haemaphysalis longicornis]|uniref:Acyl-CoA synthetase short-chain family member 3, mitochondrial n=1 Tax=Haemaphysalis longicornis TaxID=44386 RepID=A0A9J6GH25_HAELO|nr:hypothetical protein HPB48_005350 [Haemaphysalis longicornis]